MPATAPEGRPGLHGQVRRIAGNCGTEPARHEDEDLHLRQMRSPAHALSNGSRQARQWRTLVSVSLSGTGFLMLMEGAFPARRGVCEERGQTSRIGEGRLSNSRLNSSDGRNARRISPVSDAPAGWKLFDRAIKKLAILGTCAYMSAVTAPQPFR